MGSRDLWNVRVPMRDGIELSADIYRPTAGDEPRTTILARTPYNKNTGEARGRARQYADGGFNFVWMDVRGRGDSDGQFVPYRSEAWDGYDTIEWIASQAWSDGQVVSWGPSYLGYIQWLTALEQPPHLAGMIVYVTPSDLLDDWPTGVHIPLEICWFRYVDGRVLQYIYDTDWDGLCMHLPLTTLDEHVGFHSANWRRDLQHPVSDQGFWDPVRYQSRITEVSVPVLHITGWYDDAQRGTLVNFSRLASASTAEAVRRNQWLVVGPWDHGCSQSVSRRLGKIDFGESAEVDLPALEREWIGAVVGEVGPVPPRVRVFVMGRNEWKEGEHWPGDATEFTSYYLASGGDANSRHGGGRLTPRWDEAPPAPSDTFTYDPDDPVPFLSEGGTFRQMGGPDDYRSVEERGDVLVYTTDGLEVDLELGGPVRLVLYVSSSAVDTDFTAKLLDVHPDGFAQRLCDGMARVRFRLGYHDAPALLPVGEVAKLDIDVWSTAHVFLRGHRIRLEVSSSAFPKYDRNLNTGGSLVNGTEVAVAVNRVWHEPDHPSHLILPEVVR